MSAASLEEKEPNGEPNDSGLRESRPSLGILPCCLQVEANTAELDSGPAPALGIDIGTEGDTHRAIQVVKEEATERALVIEQSPL